MIALLLLMFCPAEPASNLRFSIPRIDAEIEVDGRLDEAPWSQAARLSGFSQYRPVDGRPAEERTEVLAWYSPVALHFGIIADDRDPGSIRATVADRDNISRDDSVTIYLDTFNDRRRAFFFGVNPLGVQEDGVQSEGAFNAGTLIGGTIDRNPDYRFDSRGRLSEQGYVVEIRIPFKSLRYPGSGPQSWGFNVLRKVQRTGYEDTWTDVRRASASFLAQAGTMEGLNGMQRGMVTEAQPFITAASNGTREGRRFVRGNVEADPGVNLRFGFTNLSLDATLNPDFSQVESDAGLVTVNERFALFFPEKRPFFLEGIELFATPNQLVYTRQIADPIAGGKLTGKFGRFGIAYLAALDDSGPGRAMFHVARLRRDFGASSLAGVTFTSRSAANSSNDVVAADLRHVFGRLYYVQAQLGGSRTSLDGIRAFSPIWSAEFDRTGRAWGFNYKLNAIGDSFQASSGFVPRNNVVEGHAFNRFSLYGRRGALVESVNAFFGPMRLWRYGGFGSESPIEGNELLSVIFQLRRGWNLSASAQRDFYRYDAASFRGYEVLRSGGTLEPYRAPSILSNAWNGAWSLSTPVFRPANASLEIGHGIRPIFPEGAEGKETRVQGQVHVRPTGTIRIEATGTLARLTRTRDGSEFARTVIPRLKLEYQPRRSLFFRVIAEHRSERQAQLRDARTGDLLFVNGAPAQARRFEGLRLDLLASYEPTPGTVAFFGYGSSMETNRTFRLQDFERVTDGFFVKLAYLLRR